MLKWRWVAFLAAIVPFCAGGCANLNSIHRSSNLHDGAGKVVFVDAKQRAVISGVDDETSRRLLSCSEPSPDVFSALASALGAKLLVDPAAKRGEGELSFSLSENASTIARTQTINLLRDVLPPYNWAA